MIGCRLTFVRLALFAGVALIGAIEEQRQLGCVHPNIIPPAYILRLGSGPRHNFIKRSATVWA